MNALKTLLNTVKALLFVLLPLVALVYFLTEKELRARIVMPGEELSISSSPVTLARGKNLFATRGCADCHGEDLGGQTFISSPPIGSYAGTNLTRGKGGRSDDYKQSGDWVRAIRYGLAPNGRPLVFMPSNEFSSLSRSDTGALIEYIRSMPPVDRDLGGARPGFLARVLHLAGKFPMLLPYKLVSPDAHQWVDDVPMKPTASYGAYLVTGCTGCHGASLKGGPIPGVPPEWPPAADISGTTGVMSRWELPQFKNALRTGRTPEGKQLNKDWMPWPGFSRLEDVELEALYLHLKTI